MLSPTRPQVSSNEKIRSGASAAVRALHEARARACAAAVFFRISEKERGTGIVLTWGGLHGAISVALALIVPPGPDKGIILSMTLAVVLFSILVQGLTFGSVAARFAPASGGDDEGLESPRR